jgi:hypothetical protein
VFTKPVDQRLEEKMKRMISISCADAVVFGLSALLDAQQTREQAGGAMRKVEAKEMGPSYMKPAPFAQSWSMKLLRNIRRSFCLYVVRGATGWCCPELGH